VISTVSPNRLDIAFERLRGENAGALVTFVTAGDPWPDVDRSAELVLSLANAGADVIELGIPYSDPQADGPSIQAASQRALEGGVNPPFVLDVVRRVRKKSQVPIVLMTYYNPVFRSGLSRFASDAAAAGADGFILTDLPPEEAGPWLSEADSVGLATIFLLAPTSNDARIAFVARKMTRGFIYCVSRTGVTGAQRDVPDDLAALIARIRAASSLPVCVGFGISTPEHVATVAGIADGAVIGSALVDYLHREAENSDVMANMSAMTAQWKRATRRT
jgi:tryptophan synthase alpha chain